MLPAAVDGRSNMAATQEQEEKGLECAADTTPHVFPLPQQQQQQQGCETLSH